MRTLKLNVGAAFLFLLTVSSAVAQSYVGGAVMMNAGYQAMPSLPSFQSVTDGTVRFHKGYTIIGSELNFRDGKSVILLSGYIGLQEGKRYEGSVLEPFLWKIHAGFGRVVFQTESFFLYPVAGLGVLESSLISNTGTVSYTVTSERILTLDCGIHADYFLNSHLKQNGVFSIAMVSLRIGYTKGLSLQELQGVSCTLSFGGIAFMKHKS